MEHASRLPDRFSLRYAQISDLPAIERAGGLAFGSEEIGQEVAAAVARSIKTFGETPLRDQDGFVQLRYHVAIDKATQDLAGMAGLYHPTWIGPHVLYLAWFFVNPEHQGQGLGRGLLESSLILAKLQGAERMMVETSDGLDPAQRLYAEFGFTECGRVPDYWGSSALVLLTRRLDDIVIP